MIKAVAPFFANPVFALLVTLLVMATLLLLVWLGRIPLVYNFRNLVVRWKTTLMTALAFTMVVSLLTVMLAFVNGMTILTETSGQPGNVLVLSQGATDEAFSNLGFSDVGDIQNQPGVLREGNQPLCSAETYIVVNQPIPNAPAGRPKRRFVQVRGVEDSALAGRVHGMSLLDPDGSQLTPSTDGKKPLQKDQWLSPAGVQQADAPQSAPPAVGFKGAPPAGTAIQGVLGEGIARVLGLDRSDAERAAARDPKRLVAGDTFVLGDRQWIVAGVMRNSGSSFDSEVWAKGSIVRPMFGKNNFSSLVLRTANVESAHKVKEFFSTQYKKAAVQAMVETEYFAGLSATNQTFLYATLVVAMFVALGGVFGIMNTMFAAISQRTKDIGVLRIIGFRRWQILVSLMLESLTIALLGALLGLALGMLCHGWTATSIVSSGQGGGKFVVLRLVVDGPILGGLLLLSTLMGLLGGLLPALLSGIRLKPLEALK